MIPDDQVEEVRARADIVEIIGEVVSLKKAGREYSGLCPFHDEKSPSFSVNPAKGVYHCFGCGASGDVFNFVRERLGMDFVEAVKHVAGRAGVEVREVKTGFAEEEDPRRPLFEANAFAQKWFRDQLLDPRVGVPARAYLEERGIDQETAERFGLGFAPDEWRALREAAAHHGMTPELLLEVGLLTTSEHSPDPYDRFRGRLIFPIEAVGGRIIGFGGRIIGAGGPGQPKYLNSPETPIYHKGETLYGLHRARHAIRRDEVVLVVEGYMDVVALSSAGFENAVAPLGTAMTDDQARLIRRYTQRALLLYDSDRAGLKATFRSGDALLAQGVHPSVVTLPLGEDPDTLVRKAGAPALQGFLDGAVDVLDRKIQILDERDYFSSIDRRRDAVDKLLPTLRATADPALRDIYVDRVSEKTGVRRETLEAELARARAEAPQHRAGSESPPRPRLPVPVAGRGGTLGPEISLLRVLARDRQRRHLLLEMTLERVGPEDFKDPGNRAIFQAFLDDPELGAPPDQLDPGVAERLSRLLAQPPDEGQLAHAEREFLGAVAQIEGARLGREIDELQRRIEASTDDTEKLRLIQEKKRLTQERNVRGHSGGGEYARRLARGYHQQD
ncbi:MAG TPA: DNA primase [Longimicrobiales bacterium]|nr:DNA primase [Longimicrobiales bacterium]